MNTDSTTEKFDSESVVLEKDDDLAIIRLGGPTERAVILTESRMKSLQRAVDEIAKDSAIKGVVIIGAEPSIFCAGADINVIKSVSDPAVGEELARMGQNIFNSIAALNARTVAAISGACVGGGCELVLACDHRVATTSGKTRIGLPEVKLGILPGFGGTQRLPRLIGLPQSLDLMLKGRLVRADKAHRLGLVDVLVEPDRVASADEGDLFQKLFHAASDVARGKRSTNRRGISLRDKILTNTGFGRNLVVQGATKQLNSRSESRHYPAPPKIIESAAYGLTHGLEKGFAFEAKYLGELVVSPESKSLVHLYFLTEEATKRWALDNVDVADSKVAVFGAGTMGLGIVATLLMSGIKVVLLDPFDKARVAAKGRVQKILEGRRSYTAQDVERCLGNLEVTSDFERIRDANYIIEAIIEDLQAKQDLFHSVTKLVSPQSIIASNTSSLPISDIANGIEGDSRVIGMHFFNPVEKMPLVEVVVSPSSDNRAIAHTAALAVHLGKYPVVVTECAGFLVNRLLSPYLVEAAALLSEGYAIADIDRAATDFGMPMGPLRLLDEVGLDVAGHVAAIMQKVYGERMEGPAFAAKLAGAGRLGRKSGSGFYRYEGKEAQNDDSVLAVLELSSGNGHAKENASALLMDRLILSMVNEAILCLDEGVAGAPGAEAAGQVDLGTVMGLGFAPFRGGIVHYAERRGAADLHKRLAELEVNHGVRFTPAPGIKARAESGKSFYEAVSV